MWASRMPPEVEDCGTRARNHANRHSHRLGGGGGGGFVEGVGGGGGGGGVGPTKNQTKLHYRW